MVFTLIRVQDQQLLESRANYSDGKRAAKIARLLSKKTGALYQVRKFDASATNSDWRKRELDRFNIGEYQYLFVDLDKLSRESFPDHFAHVAKKNPALIAYTKDAQKGAADKQSLLSVAAYVQLLVDKGAIDNDTAQKLIAAQLDYAGANKTPVKFARTPEEIQHVYTNYASNCRAVSGSCMHYGADNWTLIAGEDWNHPAGVYGAGDLAIAYLTDDDNETIARAVVWESKKIYSRVYADDARLHDYLKALGYEKSAYHGGDVSLEGARLLKIFNRSGALVCPYLDEIGRVRVNGEYLVIDSDGDYEAQQTDGEAREQGRYSCDNCEEHHNGDQYTVYTRGDQSRSEEWCQYCIDSGRAFYCEGTQEWYSDSSVTQLGIGDYTYCAAYVEENASYCEKLEEYTFEDCSSVIVSESGRTECWSEYAIENHALEYAGEYYDESVFDYNEVVVERYCVNPSYWQHRRGLVFYTDRVEKIPHFITERGDVEIVERDGVFYLVGYKDNYPLSRPRLDIVEDSAPLLLAAE